MKQLNIPWYKRYHWHWLILRFVLVTPFAVLHTIGEWAYIVGTWVLYKLPDAHKED